MFPIKFTSFLKIVPYIWCLKWWPWALNTLIYSTPKRQLHPFQCFENNLLTSVAYTIFCIIKSRGLLETPDFLKKHYEKNVLQLAVWDKNKLMNWHQKSISGKKVSFERRWNDLGISTLNSSWCQLQDYEFKDIQFHLKKYGSPWNLWKPNHLDKICGHHKMCPSKQLQFHLKHFSL